VAQFPGISVSLPGTHFTLIPTASGVTSVPSSEFDVSASGPGPAALFTINNGNSQVVTGGSAFPNPLVVRIADAGDTPIAGATVNWNVSGNGTLSGPTSTTDANG